ncbi:hypothetical protein BGZ51_006885 [Haplosporangium sp. Z 767]|nr:hypothetical protein BGZ50_000202 [Haplosporangium sp. Z 11]KAF9191666.1 hypothetical protein BGZ51_006885 [Haplosporangium sp. Z 767]
MTERVFKRRKTRTTRTTSSTSSRVDKYKEFHDIFRDPPDAASLLNRQGGMSKEDEGGVELAAAENSDTGDSEAEEGSESGRGEGLTRFSALRYKRDGKNQRNIMLATLFLTNRLPALMFDTSESQEPFSIMRTSRSFRALAQELAKAEPSLRGVTGIALWAMYDRLIRKFDELYKLLQVETEGRFEPTYLSDLVQELHALHEEFLTTRTLRNQEEEQERQYTTAEVEPRYTEAIAATMTPLAVRMSNKRKYAPEEQTTATSSSTSSAKTATSVVPSSSTNESSPLSVSTIVPSRSVRHDTNTTLQVYEEFRTINKDVRGTVVSATEKSNRQHVEQDHVDHDTSKDDTSISNLALSEQLKAIAQTVQTVSKSLMLLEHEFREFRMQMSGIKSSLSQQQTTLSQQQTTLLHQHTTTILNNQQTNVDHQQMQLSSIQKLLNRLQPS